MGGYLFGVIYRQIGKKRTVLLRTVPLNRIYVSSHDQFDLPHVVIFLSYDFGKGWKMSSEIEFEQGGTESAVEIESEETGEYEKEIERGGEVALEQF